jgi:hypothetical protein
MSQEAEVSQQKQICFNISLAGFAKVFTEMPIPSMNACAHVSIFYLKHIRKSIDCKGCVYKYFLENPTRNKCPQC